MHVCVYVVYAVCSVVVNIFSGIDDKKFCLF